MTDLAKLRELQSDPHSGLAFMAALMESAPSLLDEVEKLRAALRNIATSDEGGVCDSGYSANHIARQALGETK